MRVKIWRMVIAMILFSAMVQDAHSAWSRDELAGNIKISSPAAGAKVEVVKAVGLEIFGVVVNYGGGPLPAERSMVLELKPPTAQRVFSAYLLPLDPHWTDPHWSDSLLGLKPKTQFALWREPGGKWGSIIALVGGGMVTTLESNGTSLVAVSASRDAKFSPSRVPVLAIGFGDEPYRLVEELYAFGLQLMKSVDPEHVVGNLRKDKSFPEIFRYLGFCSWNTYYQAVDERKILASGRSFKAQGVPVRWVLIDDRWMAVVKTEAVNEKFRTQSLTGFEADPQKFPQGLAHTVKILKQEYGFSQVGVWLTFQGYWNGVALDSELGRDYKTALMPVSDQVGIPDPRSFAGAKFWDGWFKFLSEAGIDLVKVDNQSNLSGYVHGAMPAGWVMANAQKNLTPATDKYFRNNLIDCMEMNVDTIYQWEKTNIGRASTDYHPEKYNDPRIHQVKNVMNALWLSKLVYPDYDMWMTHDNHADYYAVARAISGGPVYITDRPGRTRLEYLRPLVYEDGRIIFADEPGLPAIASILENPYESGKPLVAFARTGDSGVLAGWNVDRKYRKVKSEFSPGEVPGLQGGRFAVYDYFQSTVRSMEREQKFPVEFRPWQVRLFVIAPVRNGFAAIGLAEKYLAPATIRKLVVSEDKALLTLAESGKFAAFVDAKPQSVKADGKEMFPASASYANNLLVVELPPAAKPVELEIVFRKGIEK